MTEKGGPTAQAGIRYQDRVAALHLGRMIDPRERPRRDRPVEVRVESLDDVDDFVVRYDDGSHRYVQVKLTLRHGGETWKSLWLALHRQLARGLSPDDRLELVLGEPSTLASNLKELARRTDGADTEEWRRRLNDKQRAIASSIADAIGEDHAEVFRIFESLDLSVWPSNELERDYVPVWMPDTNAHATQLFETLAGLAWAGSETRSRFDGAQLRDRLEAEQGISVADPPSWGLDRYRAAVAALAGIEVPGTDFQPAPDNDFIWPRCLRYDRDRTPDFDDDLPGWRDLSGNEEVDLSSFPGVDLNAVVVVAGPGFGKSTLLKAIARRTAIAGLVPAMIPVTKLSDSDLTIAEYLECVINAEFDVNIDWGTAAATGALVLLLDGLDEVSSHRRTLMLERLKVHHAAHPNTRWMMTVRDAAVLAPPSGATMIELAPLRDVDVSHYVGFYRPGEQGVAEGLLERIRIRTDLAHLARIPMFLALMLVMRLEGAELRRSDLLDAYIETLLRPAAFKHTESETVDVTSLRRIAERAAFDALETDSIGVTNELLAHSVNKIAPTAPADEILEAFVRRGVLRRSGLTRLTFPFPIVQEFLASEVLLEQPTGNLVQRLNLVFKRPWAQAIQFALERHRDPAPLVDEILGQYDDVFHTRLRLVGRCLANGMAVTSSQREKIGDRLASIWGRGSWRTNKLINGVIVDAFSKPLHHAVRARLGERRLIHEDSGTIVALNRDTELTMWVLRKLLTGDIKYLLNIGKLQEEVDRIGTEVLELYIARCRRSSGREEDENAISCLIGHMSTDSIDSDTAYAAAADESLPTQVRLAAWNKTGNGLDEAMEILVVESLREDGYHPKAAAALALSSPIVDVQTIVRLLETAAVSAKDAEEFLNCLIAHWHGAERHDLIREFIAAEGLGEPLRDLVQLYSISDGNTETLDGLIDRIEGLGAGLVCAILELLGNAPERNRVERAVAAIAGRTWSTGDRVSIAAAFAMGLTHRMKMLGFRAGTLEPIALHPGRNAPHELLKGWLAYDDYDEKERLHLVMDAVQLGIVDARSELRPVLDAALAIGVGEDLNDSHLAGLAIEILHANGEGLAPDELEQLVRNSSYNLATSAAALIAAGGTEADAIILMRLYEAVSDGMLQSTILGHLEPLASRLGLHITRKGRQLSAVHV